MLLKIFLDNLYNYLNLWRKLTQVSVGLNASRIYFYYKENIQFIFSL